MRVDTHRTMYQPGMDLEPRRRNLDLGTPEGVTISFGLASPADRLVAFLIDAVIIVLALIATLLVLPLAGGPSGVAAALLIVFVLRNFYFIWFEQRWQGSTPGKRLRGLRVIDAHGGQLEMGSVIVRNLTREVEILLPLTLIALPHLFWPAVPPWARLVAVVWPLVFGLMPVLNKSHRRVGDLVAGTLVVLAPKPVLLEDLTADRPKPLYAAQQEYKFTRGQLDVYGIYELQVLEDILRKGHRVDAAEVRAKVRETIQKRIGWDGPVGDDEAFLKAFYTAQRAHLERKMLFGKRRRDKLDTDS
jgi:uncharacterized RDD family membrane protein YckC